MRVAIPHTKPAMYVALVVAQHRDKKGAISGIQNDALASAFRKIATAAVRMKGVSLSVVLVFYEWWCSICTFATHRRRHSRL